MARSKGTELSVFKGREAKLNRAIFQALALRSPLTIYDVYKQMKTIRGVRRTKYTNVSRRVRDLEDSGYLCRAGIRSTQAGGQASLYELTTRTHVALLLDQVSPDALTTETDENTLIAELAALVLYLDRNRRTDGDDGRSIE